ncbi:hybrid sensor histidine kinase/response regulator [Thauera humireducens]|uniref:Virulence sensor protein BvgS n=1 Tax=Thauera humireducens TaxID=1134435 RepID=A0A127KAC1_9RHOO|nr:hybrid sensor histidine kinase/response regulator [Thauera humireducens]
MRVRRWSQGAESLFGWREDEVRGRRPDEWAFFHADDLLVAQAAVGELLAGTVERNQARVRNYARNGTLAHTEWRNVIRRDSAGRAVSILSYINELTRQHHAEHASTNSSGRYQGIFANGHAVMLILDPQTGRIVDANPAAERFYGWPRATLLGMRIGQINTLSDHELQAELEAARTTRRHHFEFRHRRADGSIRDVEVYSGPTEDEGRALLFSIVHDVTERKRAETVMRRWERFFRLSHLGIAMHEVDGNTFIDVNDAYARQHGYTPDELRGTRVMAMYTPEERALLPARLAEADRVGNVSFESVHFRKDGSRIPLLIGITALQDDSGETVARFVFTLDISARKAAEEKLRKLSRAVEESPESLVITNTNGEIEYVNQSFVEKTGYTLEEVLGKNPRILQSGLTPRETFRDMWATLTCGETWRGELHNRHRDGRILLERVTITPIHDDDGGRTTHYVAVKEDITEKRRMEEELLRHREQLESLVESRTAELQQALEAAKVASRAKDEFLATMSHEIRTPMNGVIGILDVLAHQGLSADQAELVAIMDESAATLLRLIDDILDFSRIESGQLQLEIAPVSIRGLMANIEHSLAVHARKTAVQLRTHIGDTVPELMLTDELRLRQVLTNLIGNAIKFSAGRDRPGRVELRVEVSDAGLIRFMVTDNGIGIAPEVFEKIFQPFSQAESSTTRRFGGSGLGLTISARLVQLLKGRIDLRSIPGRGSRFVVTLPLATVSPAAAAMPSLTATDRGREGQVTGDIALGRILLAEDNPINRRVIEHQLTLLGLQCDMAENGREALERWRTGDYALLLTDLHMPEMDGYELTAHIRREESGTGKRLPIIAVTANAMRGEDRHCLDAGMDDFIAKPVQFETLRRALQRWAPSGSTPAASLPSAPDRIADPAPSPAAPKTGAALALLDPRVLANLIGNDEAMIEALLVEYRVSLLDSARQMRAALAANDWQRLGEVAHRLKSASRSVGALQLGELCAALEAAGHAGRAADAGQLMQGFRAAVDAVSSAIEARRGCP